MFNLGLWEIFILAAVALIVVGPDKLPKLARDVARFLNEVKRTTGSITQEMNKALDEDEFQKSSNQSKIEEQPPEDPLGALKNSAESEDSEKTANTTDPIVEETVKNNSENNPDNKTKNSIEDKTDV